MATIRIKLGDPWEAWRVGVRSGQIHHGDGTADAVLVLTEPDEPERDLQLEKRTLPQLQTPGVLQLRHLSRQSAGVVSVYDGFSGASAAHLLRGLRARRRLMPLRCALELGIEVMRCMMLVPQDIAGVLVVHPGPSAVDVLVDAEGRVRVCGFRAMEAARVRADVEVGLAPRTEACGALLAELLSGERAPPRGAGRDVRRVERMLSSLNARPNETVPYALLDLIRSCLDPEPGLRPPLPRALHLARKVLRDLPGRSLRDWAERHVPPAIGDLGALGGRAAWEEEQSSRRDLVAAVPVPELPHRRAVEEDSQEVAPTVVALPGEVGPPPAARARVDRDPVDPEAAVGGAWMQELVGDPASQSDDAEEWDDPPFDDGELGSDMDLDMASLEPPLDRLAPLAQAAKVENVRPMDLPDPTAPALTAPPPVADVAALSPIRLQPSVEENTLAMRVEPANAAAEDRRRGPDVVMLLLVAATLVLSVGLLVLLASGHSMERGTNQVLAWAGQDVEPGVRSGLTAAPSPPAPQPTPKARPVDVVADPPSPPPAPVGRTPSAPEAPAVVPVAAPAPAPRAAPAQRAAPAPQRAPAPRAAPAQRASPEPQPSPARRSAPPDEDPAPRNGVRIQAPGPWSPPDVPAPEANDAPPPPAIFPVVFQVADPDVRLLTVSCHLGGEVSGVGSVTVSEAGPGPCRMTAEREDGAFTTTVSITRPHTFICFAGGSRRCK